MKKVELTTPADLLNKLKLHLGIKRSYELANFIGVKPNTISSWKMRDSIPYHHILGICIKYDIDLNDLFLDNYPKNNPDDHQVQVPILYINNYWDYYFDPTFKNTALLPSASFPANVDFDIIIQITTESKLELKSKLLFTFCKRVDHNTLTIGENYILIIKDRGFVYTKVLALNLATDVVRLEVDGSKVILVNTKNILETFLCKGFFKDR